MSERALVRAAGGVVWRPGPDGSGQVEVALVHRPAYDDWTLPKGKLRRGEREDAAALREVREETGYRCSLGARLIQVRYQDRNGRDKVVTYWAMTPKRGQFRPNKEVDELRWLPLSGAAELLSYDHDREVLQHFDVRQALPTG